MRYILVWWIIHAGHSQVMHMERNFESEKACVEYAAAVVPSDKPVRWRCSAE
jgi:hypothetical protein